MKDEKLARNLTTSPLNMLNEKIAVVGVSLEPNKYGHKIFMELVRAKYQVVGINPRGGEVGGRKLFTSLDQVEPHPDLVITVVPPKKTEAVVKNCQSLGIKKIWMQPGSESEVAIEIAKKAGIEIVANACFMVNQKLW